MARLNDPRTYATPQRPIPVILARDEEALVSDHEEPNEKVGVRAPPPAYGNWRSTVVSLGNRDCRLVANANCKSTENEPEFDVLAASR